MSQKNPKKITLRGLIINDEGQILVCYYKRFRTYMSPGGHLDKGETLLEALKRELWEELGSTKIKVIDHILDIYTVPDDTLSKYYLVKINKIDLKNRNLEKGEIKDGLTIKWVDIKNILKHNNKEYYKSLRWDIGLPYMIKRELEFYKEIYKKYFL